MLIGLVPMVIYVVSGGVLGATGTELSATGSPARLLLYGTAYLWAVAWLATHLQHARTYLRGTWLMWMLPAYASLSMAWSVFPQKTLLDAGHLWGAVLVAWAAVAASRARPLALSIALLCATSLVLAIALAAIRAGLGFAIDFESGRWAGATGNANTLGMVCMVTIAAGSYVFIESKTWLPRLCLIAPLMLAIVNLRGSGSATSLIVSLLAVAGMCWLLIGRGAARSRIAGRVGAAVAVLLLAAVVVAVLRPELLQLQTFMHAIGRSENFTGRDSLWSFALDQFRQQPWLGYGFDSLASVLGKVNMAVGQLHNGYLDLLVRGGVVGMSLFVMMTLIALSRTFVTTTRESAPAWSTVLLLAVLVHNIAESSLARSTNTLWLLYTIAAFVAAHCALREQRLETGRTQDAPGLPHPAGAPALPNLLR